MLTLQTIVTIVRALVGAGQTDDQIIASLQASGCDADTTPPPAMPSPSTPAQLRGGMMPSVKYRLAPGMNAQRLEQRLNGRKLQIASLILQHNGTSDANGGITKRALLQAITASDFPGTNGAVMSAVHGLQTMGIVRSVELPNASAPKPPSKPAAHGTRVALATKR